MQLNELMNKASSDVTPMFVPTLRSLNRMSASATSPSHHFQSSLSIGSASMMFAFLRFLRLGFPFELFVLLL